MFGFEKLDVWRVAIEYADTIYQKTEHFPDTERYGLTSQLRRAAVSISSNIAEGSGRGSNSDFTRFIHIAYGSLMETISLVTIAQNRRFLDELSYQQLYEQGERLAQMLSRLRTSLRG